MANIEEGSEGFYWTDIVLYPRDGDDLWYGPVDPQTEQWIGTPSRLFSTRSSFYGSQVYVKKLEEKEWKDDKNVWQKSVVYRLGIPENWKYTLMQKKRVQRYDEKFGEYSEYVYQAIYPVYPRAAQ